MYHIRNTRLIKLIKVSAISAAVAVTAAGCVTQDDQALYSSSVVMFQQGQQEQAYKNLAGLCSKFPEETKFCTDAANFKKQIYDTKMAFVAEKLSAPQPIALDVLSQTDATLRSAEMYASDTNSINSFKNKLYTAKTFTEKTIADAKAKSAVENEAGRYIEAYEAIDSVKHLNASELAPMAQDLSKKAVSELKPQLKEMADSEEWMKAAALADRLTKLAPEDAFIKEYKDKAAQNSSSAYYAAKAEQFTAAGDLKKAIDYYNKAIAYPDASQETKKALSAVQIKLVEFDFANGMELASQDLYKQAYDKLAEAFSVMKGLTIEQRTMIAVPKNDLNRYYDNIFYHGQKAKEAGSLGLAWCYYKMLYDLVPSYAGLLAEKKDVEEKILARSLKSIAVIPFKSPANEPELGLQASSSIMQILQKQLGNDVKIIERGALEVLLREYELAVAGNVSANAETDGFKIKSADYLLMGEVLDSRTETNVQNSKRKDRVPIGTEKVRNIEWEDWQKDAEKAKQAGRDLPPEPKKYIEKPVYDYAEYDVSFYDKFSYLSISYRVVETAQGRVSYSNTVQSQKEAKDEATSGIDLGAFKVPMKAAKLPTDIELSNEVRKQVIDKISSQIIDIFKDQDIKYETSAEKLESTNNLKEAVEMYANAIILMKKKQKDTTMLESKVGKYLDVLATY